MSHHASDHPGYAVNPLLAEHVARKRLVEEVMAIKGRSLPLPERNEYRHRIESTLTLAELVLLRDELLAELDVP